MTAIGKLLDFYELKDAAIYAMTADGTALTYSSKVDIPGVMSISVKPGDVRNIKLTGDNKVRRLAGRVLTYKITVKHSAANLDAWATLTGGTAATSGTTPNTTASFTQKGADMFGTIKIAGLIANAKDAGSVNGANGTLTLYKCTVTSPPSWDHDDKGVEWTWEAEAIPTEYDDKIFDIVANETAATLS